MSTGASIAESSLKPKNFAGADFTNSPITERLKENAYEAIEEVAVKVARTENELRSKATVIGEALAKGDFAKLKKDLDTAELQSVTMDKELQGYTAKAQKFIEAHPIVSLGIAFTAGLLVHRLLKD